MAFIAGTKIFTDKGWKKIEGISGKDRVLVRNFIGDAEFIQPFALKKREYNGKIVHFGSAYWALQVTPDHKVVFEEETRIADDIMVDKHKHLYRKFRYIREDKASEFIMLKNGDTERQLSITDEDWYTLVAYTVMKGYISKESTPRLKFFLNMNNILPVIEILDKWGITWNSEVKDDRVVLTVNRDNNLPLKLRRHLGARARRDMKLPNKMVYGSSQKLMKHFIGAVLNLVAKPAKNRPNQYVFTSYNKKLLETMKTMCMFVGYGFSMTPNTAGEYTVAIIPGGVSPWSVRYIEKHKYSGLVYEIDLFDGLVYATEKQLPVWISPK